MDSTKIPIDELEEYKIDVPFERVIDFEKTRSLSYRPTRGEIRTNIHIGQRKLLLSEIEFLTLHGHLSNFVVYVGAAHGIHIKYLSELFPNHTFHLYDPATFLIKETNKIKIYNKYFLTSTAEKYKNKNVLFISDIRTTPDKQLGNEIDDDWEAEIARDMDFQAKWVKIIDPVMSMLKFRLPYKSGTTLYFPGNIYWQAWAPQSSTETRLITNVYDHIKSYDNDLYNDICFRFNRITRSQWYPHDITDVPGIDHCYDCMTEIHILGEYLNKFKSTIVNKNKTIANMMNRITSELGSTARLDTAPHGLYPDIKDRKTKLELLAKESDKYQNYKINKRNKFNKERKNNKIYTPE